MRKEIIFIDDRISNIKYLENFCKAANIPFLGIHDNRIFSKYNHFNQKIGKFHFEYLEKHNVWLRDTEATARSALSVNRALFDHQLRRSYRPVAVS